MVENAEAKAREARARVNELIRSLREDPRPPHNWWQGGKLSEPRMTHQISHDSTVPDISSLTPAERRLAEGLKYDYIEVSFPIPEPSR